MIVDAVQPVIASRFGPLLRSAWRTALHAGFLVLCVRFLVATFQHTYPEVGPALLLIIGSAGLGGWRPRAALFAFTCAVPLLNGLGNVGLGSIPLPPSVVFSALFIGISCRWVFRRAKDLKEQKSKPLSPKDDNKTNEHDWSAANAPTIVIDILISVILISLIGQVARHLNDVSFWAKFWRQSVFGYGDRLYFVSSAFLWMQGMFFFKLLVDERAFCRLSQVRQALFARFTLSATVRGIASAVSQVTPAKRSEIHPLARLSRASDDKQDLDGCVLATRFRPALLAWVLCSLVFIFIQRQWDLPQRYVGFVYHSYVGFVYTSLFEDIHSFGAITVTSLAFFLAAFRFTPAWRAIGSALCAMILLALTILSWSRATWLAGFSIIMLLTLIRVSWKWRIAIVLAGAGLLNVGNQAAKTSAWQNSPYLSRLGTLVRFENPAKKDPSRMNLYHKALGMIREHPVTGHGIGSFYLKSVNYANVDDPHATIPNFAHNVFLQFAAELGAPAALLLAGLLALALVQGYRHSFQLFRAPGSDLTVFGITMALMAYLITQMTANALNIYVSNQFLFWFLMATLLRGVRRGGESGRGSDPSSLRWSST